MNELNTGDILYRVDSDSNVVTIEITELTTFNKSDVIITYEYETDEIKAAFIERCTDKRIEVYTGSSSDTYFKDFKAAYNYSKYLVTSELIVVVNDLANKMEDHAFGFLGDNVETIKNAFYNLYKLSKEFYERSKN